MSTWHTTRKREGRKQSGKQREIIHPVDLNVADPTTPVTATPAADTIGHGGVEGMLEEYRNDTTSRLKKQLPVLRRRIRELTANMDTMRGIRHMAREYMDAREEHADLRCQLSQFEDGMNDITVQRCIDRLETKACDNQVVHDTVAMELCGHDPVIVNIDDGTCDSCGPGHRMRRLGMESLMSCGTCGNSEPYMETNINAHGHDKIEYQSFSYKRSNHFIEWLNASQGREHTGVPTDVLDACCKQIHLEGIPTEKVTTKTVRAILKTIGKRKHYENCTLIWSKLTGKIPARFTATQEEALKAMFLSIQEPFEEARATVAPERRNFLSYSYCLFKFCELLGLDQFLGSFSLLKGRDKLHKQDLIFQQICIRLNWQFLPSI